MSPRSPRPPAPEPKPPRAARADALILDATRELLADAGMAALTVERVAARAGVAKTTIYRRYRSRDDLALAVLVDMVRTVAAVPDLQDTRAELTAFLRASVRVLADTLMGRVMQGLVSELAADDRLAGLFQERVVALRRAELTRIVTRGIERGEVRPDPDLPLVHELLFGPVYYRLLLSGSPLEPALADAVVDVVYPALLAQTAPGTRAEEPDPVSPG